MSETIPHQDLLVDAAAQEALALGVEYIALTHLVLAAIKFDTGFAAALAEAGVDLAGLSASLAGEGLRHTRSALGRRPRNPPLTSRVTALLPRAASNWRARGGTGMATFDILMALLNSRWDPASKLSAAGVTPAVLLSCLRDSLDGN